MVVPTYLRPEAVKKCVHSVLDGSVRPDEIILVGRYGDDATKGVFERLRLAVGDSCRIRFTQVTADGHIPPVEAGVRLASGEIVAIVDDDVTVSRWWLSALLQDFSDPSVGVVGGRVAVPGYPEPKLRGRPGCLSWYGKAWGNVGFLRGSRAIDVDTVMEGNWSWRRDLLLSIQIDPVLNFDDACMYGLDLCLEARALGFRVLYEPRAVVDHHLAPRAPRLDRAERPARVYSYCRNYTYIMLKRLPWWRKAVFLAWWFGLGERVGVGAAALVVDLLLRRRREPGEARRAFAGKIEGIRVWLRRPRGGPEMSGRAGPSEA